MLKGMARIESVGKEHVISCRMRLCPGLLQELKCLWGGVTKGVQRYVI